MHLPFFLAIFLPFVLCDTVNVNSPTRYQVINNSSFLVDYTIQRNGMLYLTNTTTELLDVNRTSLVLVTKDLTNSTSVRLDMRTFVQPNTVTNFTVRIVAFGKYGRPQNGQLFDNITTEVPLQLNLLTKSSVTLRPTTTFTFTPTSRPNRTRTSDSYINTSKFIGTFTSFFVLFFM